MKKKLSIILSLLSLLVVSVFAEINVIPLPRSLTEVAGDGVLFNADSHVYYQGDGAKGVAEILAETLHANTGLTLTVMQMKKGQQLKGSIFLEVRPAEKGENTEAYSLNSARGYVEIKAASAGGLFNATQTLIQLVPIGGNTVPAVKIEDEPSYKWRGMMLDVSRYFFTKKYVLRYLDMMALHKMNVLHWHLVDDAGWRIEIKKYPKLTEVGAWRGKGDNRYGGFYTQEDIREIVAYAAARNITIVPEIELPAHTLPALVAYPHLGCFNRQFSVPTRHSISPELYCAGKDSTWEFLEDVFTEVCELFPGEFIHIGGDEARFQRWDKCPDCQKKMKQLKLKHGHQLQGWMTTRIEKFLKTKNKRIIGWEEILGAGVSTDAGIMTWYKPSTAVRGAQRGNPVVMSLTGHAYFDVAESNLPGEPPAAGWIPPISLKKAYEWTPTPKKMSVGAANNILGASACLWSDMFLHKADILADKPGEGTKRSEDYVDYLSLPRMAALAEVCWTPESIRLRGGFDDFSNRMAPMYLRYLKRGYHFRIPVPEVKVSGSSSAGYVISAKPAIIGGSIRYTTDGSTPQKDSKELSGSLSLATLNGFKAATFTPDSSRQSLLFIHREKVNKYAKFGEKVGEWKAGKVGNAKPMEVSFDATGKINSNGTYLVTFIYTGGRQRLDIDGIKLVRNDTVAAGEDNHHGFTGGKSKNNSYKIKVINYQTGASFKVNAMIYGDEGDDSNGIVFIRKVGK